MEEQRTKRPIFTPIVLVLLTFSLIGNVFLYTLKLQNDQNARVARGTAILQSGNAAQAFLAGAAKEAGELAGSSDAGSRLSAKSKLLARYSQAAALSDFVNEAEKRSGKPFPAPKRSADEFVAQTFEALQTLGNHEGPLTDGEKAYVQQLLQVFQACEQELSAFQHDTINQEQSLVILVDDSWPPIAAKLLAHMNQPEALSFKG